MHPLLDFENRTKTRLAAGELTRGLFLLSSSAMIAEACTTAPIDWILVDAEASAVTRAQVLHIFQAITGTGVTPMIRVAKLDQQHIEHALDAGAHAILVPKVNTPDEARAAAAACYYPPRGTRGINPVRVSGYLSAVKDYLAAANARTMCMVQIETATAVENVDAIAAVDGVDVLFIGPGDLASSLGQPGDVTGPAMQRARQRVLEATARHGKIAGIFAYSHELAALHRDEGFRFLAAGNDIAFLKQGLAGALGALEKA